MSDENTTNTQKYTTYRIRFHTLQELLSIFELRLSEVNTRLHSIHHIRKLHRALKWEKQRAQRFTFIVCTARKREHGKMEGSIYRTQLYSKLFVSFSLWERFQNITYIRIPKWLAQCALFAIPHFIARLMCLTYVWWMLVQQLN